MENTEERNIGYQFTPIPLNLMACCDLNCRSMLWTLIQLSNYFATEDGWLFRTNEDLRAQSRMSENLVRATISTFYRLGIIDVQTVGKSKSKTPNKFRLKSERFVDWEKYSLEDCIKHPELLIETDNYKAKGWQPSYMKLDIETGNNTIDIPTSSPIVPQSEDNIKNEENKNNILSEHHKQIEVNYNSFEEYKKLEDMLMDKLYHVTTWTDFKTFKKQIFELISTASSEKIAEKTKKRFTPIAEGKIRFLKGKISKEPYNSYYDDFYEEYDCGWLGKENRTTNPQPQQETEEEDENIVATREILKLYGIDFPNEKERERADKDNITRVPEPSEKQEWDELPF